MMPWLIAESGMPGMVLLRLCLTLTIGALACAKAIRTLHPCQFMLSAPCFGGYDRKFKLGVGRPRFKPEVRSFEFPGSVPDGAVKKVSVVRHSLGTGFDVQLVKQRPGSDAACSRDDLGLGLRLKAPCSLSSGAHYEPAKISDRE